MIATSNGAAFGSGDVPAPGVVDHLPQQRAAVASAFGSGGDDIFTFNDAPFLGSAVGVAAR